MVYQHLQNESRKEFPLVSLDAIRIWLIKSNFKVALAKDVGPVNRGFFLECLIRSMMETF